MKGLNLDVNDINLDTDIDNKEKAPTVPAVKRRKIEKLNRANTMRKMVLGREVVFTRVVIEAGEVEKSTNVFYLNERDQELLNEHGVADILPEITRDGINSFEAYARPLDDKFELADGSRRRRACILGNAALAMWTAELNDREMEYLSESGNKHKQASVYERGLVFQRWLDEGRYSSIKDIERETSHNRRTIQRCIHAAKLPKWLISAYKTPNDMSVDASAKLYTIITENRIPEDTLKKRVDGCKIMWNHADYKGSDITNMLTQPLKSAMVKDDVNWLVKNKAKVNEVGNVTKYELTGINAEQRKKLDQFVAELLKK